MIIDPSFLDFALDAKEMANYPEVFSKHFIEQCEKNVGNLDEFPVSKIALYTILLTKNAYIPELCSTIQTFRAINSENEGKYFNASLESFDAIVFQTRQLHLGASWTKLA